MRTKSSKQWLKRHFSDPYVRQAQARGLSSRAVFKLEEIQKRDRFIKSGMTVIDLGAAPGSWSQLVANLVGNTGRVIALDLLPLKITANIEFIQGDFQDNAIVTQLLTVIGQKRVDVILSDIAPNLSGISAVDQARSFYLAELVDDVSQQILKRGGSLLIKVFQGEGFENFVCRLRQHFKIINFRKPAASRSESRELYILAKDFSL